MRTYKAMWAIHTLFCLLVLQALFKKRKPIICIILSAIISTSIVTFGSMNMYTIHKTTYNITTTKEITNKSQKKTKDYNLTNKTYNIVLDHQPQGTRENIKNNVDLNSVATPTTDKCFHSLILTTYNPTLPVITEKKHSSTAQKSLPQALLVGVFL